MKLFDVYWLKLNSFPSRNQIFINILHSFYSFIIYSSLFLLIFLTLLNGQVHVWHCYLPYGIGPNSNLFSYYLFLASLLILNCTGRGLKNKLYICAYINAYHVFKLIIKQRWKIHFHMLVLHNKQTVSGYFHFVILFLFRITHLLYFFFFQSLAFPWHPWTQATVRVYKPGGGHQGNSRREVVS